MVRDDIDSVRQPFEVPTPFAEGLDNREQLLVVNPIIPLMFVHFS